MALAALGRGVVEADDVAVVAFCVPRKGADTLTVSGVVAAAAREEPERDRCFLLAARRAAASSSSLSLCGFRFHDKIRFRVL
eukprot:scaffold54494_cov54-Attheya_sp.AAC.3